MAKKVIENTLLNWDGRRFWSDLELAKEAAHDLFSWLTVKEPVFVWQSNYKQGTEFSIRLMDEVWAGSKHIVYMVKRKRHDTQAA